MRDDDDKEKKIRHQPYGTLFLSMNLQTSFFDYADKPETFL